MLEVSIIMPNYNCADFIGQAITSVLDQTYHNWELIISDDASTDSSWGIIARYAAQDARIQTIYNNANEGVSARRNQAIAQARGNYIAFLDSDDIWYPEKLRLQIDYMQAHSVDICYGAFDIMDAAGQKILMLAAALKPIGYSDMLKGDRIGMLTSVVARSILPDHPFRPVVHEEMLMWLGLLKRGYVAHAIQHPLGCYRLRKGSLSSKKLKAAYAVWRLLRDDEQLGLGQSLVFFSFYSVRMLKKYLSILHYVLRWR